jgi:hypothetical protein
MPRITITPEEFKRAKLVKPGWYPTLIKEVIEELNKKKDGMNIVVDAENADAETEFMGVPTKCWFTEKFPQGAVAYVKAFNPSLDEKQLQEVEFGDTKGKFIYAKWGTNRGADGQDPPRNEITDWAPLPKKYQKLIDANNSNTAAAGMGVGGFDK